MYCISSIIKLYSNALSLRDAPLNTLLLPKHFIIGEKLFGSLENIALQ